MSPIRASGGPDLRRFIQALENQIVLALAVETVEAGAGETDQQVRDFQFGRPTFARGRNDDELTFGVIGNDVDHFFDLGGAGEGRPANLQTFLIDT